MDILSNTRLKTARRCLRLHKLRFEDGWAPVVEAEALRFGTLIHLALAMWWASFASLLASERLAATLAALQGAEADPYDRAKASAMMIGYDTRWSDQALMPVAVEMEFRSKLINPETGHASRTWEEGGKLDAIARDVAGNRMLVVEHKTSSEDISPGADYWRRLHMDSQVSFYFDGCDALGIPVDGCLYDVLEKPALRPAGVPILDGTGQRIVLDASGQRVKTAKGTWRQTSSTADGYTLQTRPETPEEFQARCLEAISSDPAAYYQRGEVARLEADRAEARADVWQVAQALQMARRTGQWPRNPDACIFRGGTCAFWEVCSGQASLEDQTKYRRLENVNPELAAQPKEEVA
jgi:hypothetical protein